MENIIIGRNPVLEAIKSGREIDKIIVKKGESEGSIVTLIKKAKSLKIPVVEADKAKLESLLKDTGTFGKSTLKSFGRMKFDTEESFEEFFNEVKEDLDQLNQERANDGLGKFGAPQVETKPQEPEKPKPLTNEELDELAELL